LKTIHFEGEDKTPQAQLRVRAKPSERKEQNLTGAADGDGEASLPAQTNS